ncbi:alkaline shock response membrane anchor protein AmaP [Schleiferilactobacillus shenzhenensis]|uniref:Alkaline shock response membrane anchor protein AmaP n=1 Tax=Schleiferilactobacillus shenzhenensis LY-73 TaxID=1231336 RepID=U4TTZ0_9LACO|nr:alkaline shock response membrane anchor protein AmaP [Schleiferilactobacillus shenzhenensis]ERL64907.1 hypothetical protein L248_0511 [Schleiferilactobacillus shenzhenensis LY-73]
MRSGTKIVLTLLGLVALAAPLLLLILAAPAVPWLLPIRRWLSDQTWLATTAAILSMWTLLYLLGAMLRILFKKATTDQLTFATRDGELHISETAVANTVERSVVANHPVTHVEAHVALLDRGQKARVKVAAFTHHDQGLKQLGASIEETVRTQLQTTLGIPVEKVWVTVSPGKPANARVI